MSVLHSYKNGNVDITIHSDGTRTMEYEGESRFDFPTSADVKITNYCNPTVDNPICSYCHEMSNLHGKHGDLFKLLEVLSVFPKGSELAHGGGAPLSHPDILPFLKILKSRGVISNITINQKHLAQDKDLILSLIEQGLVNGIGISYSDSRYLPDVIPIIKASDNIVFHVIMGINNTSDIDDLNKFCSSLNKKCKVLILGYKEYGSGLKYLKNHKVEENKFSWYTKLGLKFKDSNLVLSFDNLAIKQMNLKRFFLQEAWDKFYQGNDGTSTLYIDGVKQEFALSSTSKDRVSFNDIDLLDYFRSLSK